MTIKHINNTMRRNLYITLILSFLLLATAVYGIVKSVYHCQEWLQLADFMELKPQVITRVQRILFIAYNWMAVTVILLITLISILVGYIIKQIKSHPELLDALTESSEQQYKKLNVNLLDCNIIYNGTNYKTRRQVILLLDCLLRTESHTIHYMQLNDIYQANFYDGSPGARRKVSNLKFEINDLLKDTPFCITKPSSDELALSLINKETEEKQPEKDKKATTRPPQKNKENAPSSSAEENEPLGQSENQPPKNA